MASNKLLAGTIFIILAAQSGQAALGPSVIADWLNVLQQYVRDYGIQNQLAGRYYGLVGVSVYNALLQNRKYNETNAPVANETAVAVLAAHTVLDHWFPWKFYVHDLLAKKQLSGLSDADIAAARVPAESAANKVINYRTRDGFATWTNFIPAGNNTIGKYQFTPGQTYALYPQLGDVRPLILTKSYVEQLSGKYASGFKTFPKSERQYNELAWVHAWGGKNSTNRTTEYDNQTPGFWAGGSNTSSIAGHWINITYQALPANLSLLDQARFYARLGAALSDASIAAYKVKYTVLYWRPVTAIRVGDGTGAYNPDPEWTPLLTTPPHPSYPSGHQATSGAAYQVLYSFLGKDAVNVSIGSEGGPAYGLRNFTSLKAIADEVGHSRALGGVHLPIENEDGLQLGIEAANVVIQSIK